MLEGKCGNRCTGGHYDDQSMPFVTSRRAAFHINCVSTPELSRERKWRVEVKLIHIFEKQFQFQLFSIQLIILMDLNWKDF